MKKIPMKKTFLTLFAIFIVATGTASCTRSDGQVSRQAVGSVLGGAAGAWAGSTIGSGGGKVVATATGTFLGSMIGSEIGRGIDKADLRYAKRAQSKALKAPVGETIQWENPKSSNRGTVTPTRQGRSSSGDYCREFQQTITVDGQQQSGYGTACRKPDGSWQIVN